MLFHLLYPELRLLFNLKVRLIEIFLWNALQPIVWFDFQIISPIIVERYGTIKLGNELIQSRFWLIHIRLNFMCISCYWKPGKLWWSGLLWIVGCCSGQAPPFIRILLFLWMELHKSLRIIRFSRNARKRYFLSRILNLNEFHSCLVIWCLYLMLDWTSLSFANYSLWTSLGVRLDALLLFLTNSNIIWRFCNRLSYTFLSYFLLVILIGSLFVRERVCIIFKDFSLRLLKCWIDILNLTTGLTDRVKIWVLRRATGWNKRSLWSKF